MSGSPWGGGRGGNCARLGGPEGTIRRPPRFVLDPVSQPFLAGARPEHGRATRCGVDFIANQTGTQAGGRCGSR